MKTIFWTALTSIFVLCMISCTSEYNNEIETELQVHFNNFVAEASAHGVDISLDEIDIDGYLENIDQRGTLGQCKSYSNGSKQIVIDQPYWNRINDIDREYLVFHELGHCLLDREHLDTKDSNGVCTSIMQSGESGCESEYNLENREMLLDELFEI